MRTQTAILAILLSAKSVAQEIEIAETQIQPCFKVEYVTQFIPTDGFPARPEPRSAPQLAKISAYVGLKHGSEVPASEAMLQCAREVAERIGLTNIANDANGTSAEFQVGLVQCLREGTPKVDIELAALMSHHQCQW